MSEEQDPQKAHRIKREIDVQREEYDRYVDEGSVDVSRYLRRIGELQKELKELTGEDY